MPVITHSADNDNFKFRMASAKGHLETVKLLLSDSRVNPAAAANYIARDVFSIRYASKNEHHEILRLLLSSPLIDPWVWKIVFSSNLFR